MGRPRPRATRSQRDHWNALYRCIREKGFAKTSLKDIADQISTFCMGEGQMSPGLLGVIQ